MSRTTSRKINELAECGFLGVHPQFASNTNFLTIDCELILTIANRVANKVALVHGRRNTSGAAIG
jgi:hypothetical protein